VQEKLFTGAGKPPARPLAFFIIFLPPFHSPHIRQLLPAAGAQPVFTKLSKTRMNNLRRQLVDECFSICAPFAAWKCIPARSQ